MANLITMQRKKFVYWFNSIALSNEQLPVDKLDDPAGLGEESVFLMQDEFDFYCRLSMISAVTETLGDETYFTVNSVMLNDSTTISMVYYKDILLEVVVEWKSTSNPLDIRRRRFFQPKEMKKDEIVEDFVLIMKDEVDYTRREYIDCVDKNEIDLLSLLQTYDKKKPESDDNVPSDSDFSSDWI